MSEQSAHAGAKMYPCEDGVSSKNFGRAPLMRAFCTGTQPGNCVVKDIATVGHDVLIMMGLSCRAHPNLVLLRTTWCASPGHGSHKRSFLVTCASTPARCWLPSVRLYIGFCCFDNVHCGCDR
jgi:hypothetical protein